MPCAILAIRSLSFITVHSFRIAKWLKSRSPQVCVCVFSIASVLTEIFLDDMPAGQTPHTVIVFAHNDLVDKVQPGDRVTITGIYRAVALRVNPLVSNVKSVYRTHIDVVHYKKVDIHRLRNETERG